VHLRGTGSIEIDRKKSWLLVRRAMMSMRFPQTGQRDWVVIWGSLAQVAPPSRIRQRESASPRLRLAKNPKWRMRTKPLGRTWIRNRRRNSSAETVMIFCLPPWA